MSLENKKCPILMLQKDYPNKCLEKDCMWFTGVCCSRASKIDLVTKDGEMIYTYLRPLMTLEFGKELSKEEEQMVKFALGLYRTHLTEY